MADYYFSYEKAILLGKELLPDELKSYEFCKGVITQTLRQRQVSITMGDGQKFDDIPSRCIVKNYSKYTPSLLRQITDNLLLNIGDYVQLRKPSYLTILNKPYANQIGEIVDIRESPWQRFHTMFKVNFDDRTLLLDPCEFVSAKKILYDFWR